MGDLAENDKIDCARIAMFLDTDGYITIMVRQRGIAGNAYLGPSLGFTNTSKLLIDWTHETLTRLGVPHYLKWYSVDKLKGTHSRKPQGRIVILGQNRCSKIIPLVLPYLVGKLAQGKLVAEYLASRILSKHKQLYTDRELQIANDIRALNDNKGGSWRPISSETLRQTVELRAQMKRKLKIKSDLHGDMQSAAEMTAPANIGE